MAEYARSKGVSSPELAVQGSGAMLIAGGLSVIGGFKPREGLALLIAFLVPVSIEMHRFWDAQNPSEGMVEMVNFTKNMALVGAALMMLELQDPWPLSIDEARWSPEEMYVRVGGRNLRALPA
jgi:uncharacterized membrane protein YphA (DoxX/SURF4 family)